MLAIRMQRTGRRGHAMFRMVVQDSQRTPTSGRVVAYVGSYDPHNKKVILDKDKTAFYLKHGAQPSNSVVALLKAEKVKLPKWISQVQPRQGKIKNPDKRRSTAPKDPQADLTKESAVENPVKEELPENTLDQEQKIDDQVSEPTQEVNEQTSSIE